MGAFMAEWQRRLIKEKSAKGQARAVARGATPFARVPLGYRRRDDATLEPDPNTVPLVRRAYEMRLEGASLMEIRRMLKAHGIERSHRGVQEMLASRIYLGEIHFGKLVNLNAHTPIIDPELFARVQRLVIPRGPKPKSNRLLSRLDVLRCGSCGARLVAMKLPKQGDYPIYRCPSTSDCPHHVTISAEIAERTVSSAVRRALADEEGRASAEEGARAAEVEFERTQAALDAAIRAFSVLEDEPAAIERLAELRSARDAARERLEQIGGRSASRVVSGAWDWDLLTLEEQRALIRAVVERADVRPGRGANRVHVTLVA